MCRRRRTDNQQRAHYGDPCPDLSNHCGPYPDCHCDCSSTHGFGDSNPNHYRHCCPYPLQHTRTRADSFTKTRTISHSCPYPLQHTRT